MTPLSIKNFSPNNIRTKLKSKTPDSVWKILEETASCAENRKMDVYLVGGCVRDFLLDTNTLDWDIVVQGDGQQLGEAISLKLDGKTQKKGQFLTCSVTFSDGNKLDIATARSEAYQHPAALPEVQKSSIDQDLLRRDFTINALALKLNGKDAFELKDNYGGLQDLKDGIIRILHNKSFIDDPTRAFRAIRFEKRFGFILEAETNRLLRKAIHEKIFDRLSGVRLFNELKRTLEEDFPKSYLSRSQEIQLLQTIHPNLLSSELGSELLETIQKSFLNKKISYSDLNPKSWATYFLGLLYPLENSSRQECLARLDIKGKEANNLSENLEGIEKALIILDQPNDQEAVAIFETLNDLSAEAIYILLTLAKTKSVPKAVSNYYSVYRDRVQAYITGDDLINLGFSPGPIFQEILYNLKKTRLNGDLESKEDEMKWIKQNFKP
jgi:tRNA nucleotidyltransferase (CCA-adding enzyme)